MKQQYELLTGMEPFMVGLMGQQPVGIRYNRKAWFDMIHKLSNAMIAVKGRIRWCGNGLEASKVNLI